MKQKDSCVVIDKEIHDIKKEERLDEVTMVSPGCDEWKNLIPELLLGMVGCGGGAFVYEMASQERQPQRENEDKEDHGFVGTSGYARGDDGVMRETTGLVLSEIIDWVSDAEREQFNRLAKLGWYYHRLSEFAESSCVVSKPYHAAVGQGVLEVLDVYRQAMLKIEGCLVEERGKETSLWSLLPIEHAMAEFFQLFPFLVASVDYIAGNVARGEECPASCEIIQVFENAAQSGIPIVDGCAMRITWHCYQVLFKQMYAWMVHGKLVDPMGDFFIRMDEEGGGGQQGMSTIMTDRQSSKYIAADIIESRLPRSISISFARDILYVGQCARILGSLSENPSMHGGDDASDFATSLQQICTSRRETIDWISFKKLVHTHKMHISTKVWEEMHSADRNVQGHIDNLVDILLQRRGSLYSEIAMMMTTFASNDPDPNRAPEIVAHVFREAAYLDAFEGAIPGVIGNAFSMMWYDVTNPECVLPVWHPHYDENIYIPAYDAWDGVCLKYDLKWPMHLIFPVHIIRMYGALWQLMFRITRSLDHLKRIRPVLFKLSGEGIIQKDIDGIKTRDKKMVSMHHQLYRLLSTYANHLHVEIVSRSSKELQDIFGSSSSLIDAESKHMKFVTEMVEISCIDIRQVMGVLENMFSCVKSLAMQTQTQISTSAATNIAPNSLDDLYEYFWTKYNVFYQLLQSNRLQSGQRGEAIRRLLLKLNYNGFLDINAAKQLTTHQLHIT